MFEIECDNVKMTSEIDVSRTNEFQRRRKLRLQQVREQSKDIAKKIRQRAKVEKLRHVLDLDSKKEKDYFELQDKLVGRLEQLYSQSLQNVGAGHKEASNVRDSDKKQKKDLSKLRGKEAVAELRKRKQEKLDEHKKVLDRKLQAREAANELSREKGVLLAKTLSSKSVDNLQSNNIDVCSDNIQEERATDIQKDFDDTNITKNDMGTQWEGDEIPNEWAPAVPTLSLPKDDRDSLKGSGNDRDKVDQSKRINLFALSDEMPSSLRGGGHEPMNIPSTKPSMTLITEYLQSRSLRLRENEPVINTKKSDDLQSIKQTILRSRSSKPDVSGKSDKSKSARDNVLERKKSITVYNHSTRDTHDVVYNNEGLVVREKNAADDDAYIKALKETSMVHDIENKELEKKKEEMRNKVAMTKEKVDKEYKDTLAFLNSLSKDSTSRPQKTAYMDSDRQQLQQEKHQRKLQEEFRKIERDCCKKSCKHSKNQPLHKSRSKSRSPDKSNYNHDNLPRDFQYDWMPVPESDGKFAIHTITTTANPKSSNTVKFNDVDTYHEYRSRHKHTPPTKDGSKDKERKRIVETVIIQQNSNESTDTSSAVSEASSVEYVERNKTNKDILDDPRLSDGDRIVIYKILDTKKDKKSKSDKKAKAINKIFKSLSTTDNGHSSSVKNNDKAKENPQSVEDKCVADKHEQTTLENLSEGIYKISENRDNIASMYFKESRQNANTSRVQEQTQSQHGSHNSKSVKNHSGLEQIPKDSGDMHLRNKPSCSGCKCTSENTQYPQTTSTATSTSSFQTASNDKTSNVMSDGGFLKLIDDGVQDSGKFYIGASGFLKNDNYEVVIQLKKKEAEKSECKSQEIQINSVDAPPRPTHILSKVDMEVQSSFCNNLKESSAQTSLNKEITMDEKLHNPNTEPATVTKLSSETQLNENQLIDDKGEKKNTGTAIDKSVHTSFHDSFAISANVPKMDPISRPATSTYTQTSFSSPNSRPVFLHMTSSTSTAYMSPPELILPRFLKQDRTHSHDNAVHVNANRNLLYEREHMKQNKRCKWKHSKAISTEKVHKCETRRICSTTDTPPNTAQSFDYNESLSENVECEKNKHKLHSKTCRKSRRYKNNFTLYKSSSKLLYGSNSTGALTNKNLHKLAQSRQFPPNKNGFNPVVKQYVNKLLSLNKESLKAIQVINQDCSNVDTPGSSIIYNSVNINDRFAPLQNKISLEQIKCMLEQQIIQEQAQKRQYFKMQTRVQPKFTFKLPRKKPVHKVKSLNSSKRILKNKNSQEIQKSFKNNVPVQNRLKPESSSSSTKEVLPKQLHFNKERSEDFITINKHRSKSSPTPRRTKKFIHDSDNKNKPTMKINENSVQSSAHYYSDGTQNKEDGYKLSSNRITITPISSDSERKKKCGKNTSQMFPTDISTQTSGIDSEINFMKMAENKLQNMEKIADLTERCTKRLSNLAKVLEEVRRNKSLVYSHISTSDSTSDSEPKNIKRMENNPEILESDARSENISQATSNFPEKENSDKDYNYVPLLKDIPKPLTPSTLSLSTISEKSYLPTILSSTDHTKNKAKPPPALTRVNLKNVQDFNAIPHELSTVIEVDSPMSIKQKNQSSRRELSLETQGKINANDDYKQVDKHDNEKKYDSLDLVDSKANATRWRSSSDSPENARVQMMDMKLFNDIMLKPFVSLQEYAKQCDVRIDEGSNLEDILKDDPIQDEISSLHSDGSLPDVIAELLKRKIISEPFKFDTGSHVNTTSMSSESSMSLLALSKIPKDRKKVNRFGINKENIAETSETLSISSNPDLENAFQKLGMGWASSTLKKTKERLALSSSSNTSSSSLSHLKFKSFNKDLPTISMESAVSDHNGSNQKHLSKNVIDSLKNAEQQTSLTNSMTVKEFLTNELAKKITFTNKTNKTVDDEFVSLYETKMPEEIKNTTEIVDEERSLASQSNNRARTSTPVQIFKSTIYQSTSSTNTSNGLFSNVDELSSVKVTSTSIRNHSTSDKDDLTIPNYSLKRKGLSDCSKSE